MTKPRTCLPAPGPLESYAKLFDTVFRRLPQRQGFRTYLAGLLLPRDRPKTLTVVGAEPWVQAQAAAVQRLQFFLSEAPWDSEALTSRTLEILAADPITAPTAEGVLVIDDTGDRKDGHATDHVGRQYLGSVGKIDNGIVAVTTLWTDGQRYYPLHVTPYTPSARLAEGKADPTFQSKPDIALAMIKLAQTAGIPFRVVVTDSFYGDHRELVKTLTQSGLPYVLAHRGSVGRGWAPEEQAHSFDEVIQEMPKSAWQPVTRRFRDGHTSLWWAAELSFLGYGPDKAVRAICATTDRKKLPATSTWYLTTNLPPPQATLADVVRWYGLRNWVEGGYKQMKDESGWADFMVRSDRAIRRHWALVCCAFAFGWWHDAQHIHGSSHAPPPPSIPPSPAHQDTEAPLHSPVITRWPQALRAIRAWLAPAFWLSRCWRAFSRQVPPRAFNTMLDAVIQGRGLNIYLQK